MSDDHHDFRRRVSRGVAWIGAASSAVGVLDVLTFFLLIKFFVSWEQFGIASLAATLFPLLDILGELGLTNALVARPDTREEQAHTIFWLNLGLGLVVFSLLFALAPPLFEAVQGVRLAGWLLVAYASKLVFQNFYVVPAALMRRELRFKELSIIRVIANLVEAVTKVAFAAAGMPIWCFILGPIARNLVTGIGVQLCYPWRPRLLLDVPATREHISFGVKTSASQILYQVYTNIDYQVVSFFFGEAALGVYRAAFELVLYPVKYISEVITSIALSAFATLRVHGRELVEQFITFTRQNLVFISPFIALILVGAEQAMAVFLKPDAEGAAAARILCAAGILRSLSHIFPPLLDGVGRPGLTLVYTIVAAIVLPLAYVLFAMAFPGLGIRSVALAWAIAYPVAFAVLASLGLTRIGLSARSYVRRVIAIPACAALAMIPASGAHWLTRDLPAGPRLLADAVVLVLTFGLLLAYLVGISPRTAIRSLRGPPRPPA